MKTRKIIALALALVMAVSTLGVSALAADIETAGGTGSVPVTLTVPEGGGATFSVTVPTVLAISVNADSTTTCATTAKIVNNSTGSVKVSGIAVAGQNGWETVDFDSMIVANEKINAKRVALQINAEKTTGADAISFAGANWAAINGLGGELAVSDGCPHLCERRAKTPWHKTRKRIGSGRCDGSLLQLLSLFCC